MITTGIVPDGAGLACSFDSARSAAGRASSSTLCRSNSSKPMVAPDRLAPGLHAGVATGHRRDAEADPDLVVGGENPVGVGHQDLAPAVPVVGVQLPDVATGGAGGGVRPCAAARPCPPWPRRRAGSRRVTGSARGDRDRATWRRAARSASRGGRCGLSGGQQAPFGKVGGVRKTGRIADHNPDPGSPVVARTDVLDPAVVERNQRPAPVLGEHFGELAACGQGLLQHPGDDGFVHQWLGGFEWQSSPSHATGGTDARVVPDGGRARS